jgi:hypothetical protein
MDAESDNPSSKEKGTDRFSNKRQAEFMMEHAFNAQPVSAGLLA